MLDVVASTVTAYEVDGSVRWETSIPSELDGALPWDVAVGPDRVLYLSYRLDSDGTFTLVVVPVDGSSAGLAVAVRPTTWPCVETSCGDVQLAETGVPLDDAGSGGEMLPYVDADGRPSGAGYTVPQRATVDGGSGPIMPADWVGSDDVGNQIGSFRSTVSYDGGTWVVDVMGVPVVGDSDRLATDPQPDGSVVSIVSATRAAGQPGTEVWLDLLPDGSVQAWRLPDELALVISVARIGGERYLVASSSDGVTYRLLHLVPA